MISCINRLKSDYNLDSKIKSAVLGYKNRLRQNYFWNRKVLLVIGDLSESDGDFMLADNECIAAVDNLLGMVALAAVDRGSVI